MNPLPVQRGGESSVLVAPASVLPGIQPSGPPSYSNTNRRASSSPAQRAYPWLLSIRTLVAAAFCLLYITKPVIVAQSDPNEITAEKTPLAMKGNSAATASSGLMPNKDRLPGEEKSTPLEKAPVSADSRKTLPPPPLLAHFEETNLRVQHILTAEAPGDHLDRIDVDVPVLYQSRNLRWTANEVAEARVLLTRLMDYQEKTLQHRAEGVELLDSWNRLIGSSIPATELRADSPTLPSNQLDAADSPRPAGLITTESIQIKSSGK